MNNLEMMKVAQDFISLHKEAMQVNWISDLINTYYKMEDGTFGESNESDGNFSIEIRGLHSKTGNPIIFEWSNK